MPPLPATALSDARIAASSGIFLASYLVFALGKFLGLKIDRAGAAIISAVGMGHSASSLRSRRFHSSITELSFCCFP